MSKKFSRKDFIDEDYEYHGRPYSDELKQRRKLKRLNSAIKSKNIPYLMDIDDDEY
jgi:hypothetical protein